jgi:VanZ family protein
MNSRADVMRNSAPKLNTKHRDFVRRWVPVIIWVLVIFTASTDLMSATHTSRFIGPFLRWLMPDISGATIVAIQLLVRKVAHVTEYAILAALLLRALRGAARHIEWHLLLLACALAAVCAALDEYHQSFVSSRTAAVGDVLIDICGALLGLVLFSWLALRGPRGARA